VGRLGHSLSLLLGEGAVSVAVIWSEIKKLERGIEGGVKFGARAMGTGVVLKRRWRRQERLRLVKGLVFLPE